MKALFELAAGSVAGTEHQRTGKNNQDAFSSWMGESAAIAVVCDGCGSGKHSEVGAKIGARLVVEAIRSCQPEKALESDSGHFWQEVRRQVLEQIKVLAAAMGGNLGETVTDYFLFTVVGAVIVPAGAAVFALGDGAIAVNGEIERLGPFPGNAPPYLAYGLLTPTATQWQLQVYRQLPIEEVESILIGSDGVLDLISAAAKNLPGKAELVGDLSQFWQQDRYFANPDMARRRLTLINAEATRIDWQNQQLIKFPGLLPDDTTLVAIRKRDRVEK